MVKLAHPPEGVWPSWHWQQQPCRGSAVAGASAATVQVCGRADRETTGASAPQRPRRPPGWLLHQALVWDSCLPARGQQGRRWLWSATTMQLAGVFGGHAAGGHAAARQGGMRRRAGGRGEGGGGCAGTPGAATPAAGGGRPHMRTWIPECLKAAAENEFGAWEWGKQRGLARLPCGGGAGAAAVRWGRANAWVGSSGGPVRPWRPAVWASAAPCWADAWACWCCTPVAAALLCVTRGQRRG